MNLVLLCGGKCLAVKETADCRAEVASHGWGAHAQLSQELTEVSGQCFAEVREDGAALLRGNIGLYGQGECCKGDYQGSDEQVLK